jgi:hypothetical protein
MNTNANCYVGQVQTAGKPWTELFTESVWQVAAKRLKELTEANTGCRYKLVHCRSTAVIPQEPVQAALEVVYVPEPVVKAKAAPKKKRSVKSKGAK